jgi:hypothetical protein
MRAETIIDEEACSDERMRSRERRAEVIGFLISYRSYSALSQRKLFGAVWAAKLPQVE